ncbi:transport and Golgi organization protein 1 homolog isoform X1 [Pseudochaenichthys georgianus]|uniref:transport and Golgi organization protein 1 homolog isoform X1 n=1 Tax=Pseudochaenichthys georgianus TaxID=52239 RepID=UPI00146DBE15|nr:transport and Golgi organization protein 1 homolog isoform X1 [Pseudochaenichthys georgianus]
MAAKHFYRQGFLLLLFNFIATAALEKRFSDLKRCADEECSMLLIRGKALKDFTGPDCRFLTFKKSETIYVYYKLSGERPGIWAGSVGSNFGYFPDNLITVNHVYTRKEFELPAEETDFVCFDTGFDKFDSYDVDFLLDSLPEDNDGENKGTSDQIVLAEDVQEETQPSDEEETESENQTENPDDSEDLDVVPDDESASLLEPDVATESPSTEEEDEEEEEEESETETEVTPDAPESPAEHTEVKKERAFKSVLEKVVFRRSEAKDKAIKHEEKSLPKQDIVTENEPVTISEGMQIPKLKTTFGSTFDAVASDDEITRSVTPYEEEEGEFVENPPEDDIDVKEEIPLLSFSEENVNTPASDSLKKQAIPPTTQEVKPDAAEQKNMWTSIGEAVFSAVTGGERTAADLTSEEDDEDEDEVEDTPPTPLDAAEKAVEEEPVSVESQQEPENIETDLVDDDDDDDDEGEVIGPEDAPEETLKPTDEPIHHQVETISVDPESEDETAAIPDDTQNSDNETSEEPIEHKGEEEVDDDDEDFIHEADDDVENNMDEKATVTDHKLPEIETHQHTFTEEMQSNNSDVKDDEKTVDDTRPHDIQLMTDSNSNDGEPEIQEEDLTDELNDEKDIEKAEQKQELLEDENALSFSKSDTSDEASPEAALPTVSTPEPQYSDSVMRLTLLRYHFSEEKMERFQKLLGLSHLFRVEAMFSDLDTEMQVSRLSHTGTAQDIESVLEGILEASENSILDEIEKMLDGQQARRNYVEHTDKSSTDEETEILDDFQELAFALRQKYSTVSDSTPLASSDNDKDEHILKVKDDQPVIVEEDSVVSVPEAKSEDNLTVTDQEEKPAVSEDEPAVLKEVHRGPELSVEEDGGHFKKNKDNQLSFSASDELPKVPQATLENPLDLGLGVEGEHSPSGSLDPMEPVPEIPKEDEGVGLFSTGIVYMGCILSITKNAIAEWAIEVISLLPEEWKPGETFFGCPWQAVIITALVGVVTFTLFFWRTVLAVKKREYLVDEKKLTEQMLAFKKEKNEAIAHMADLQKQTEHLKESQKQSKETVSSTMKKMQNLQSKVLESETRNELIFEEKKKYAKLLENERSNSLQNSTRIEKLEKSNEKIQLSRKKAQEALAKTTVLLDEAKIREDARNVQRKCLEKDYTALKEENKTLKTTIKSWEEKHKELNEKIKVYQKSQKELEDSVVLKDHNVEVLSDLLADLDACDSQKGSSSDKKTAITNRIKQMMDVSRVQTTLTVVEEERDRFMTKLLTEEKTRKSLEEQHQELEHSIATLKSDKSHVENQFKILQQKNEIMVEMYQQKENALQQRLTKEELERRSKESQLTEVGGKAVEAEEQVKILRHRINEMEEQMKKTEEVYKEQVKEQENKTHSNWVNARNAERALNQEKLESSKLREKLGVLTSQLNERRAPLFRPNSGQHAGPRQGDSYGPSPVSGGAPSPPIMIEGPRRPPSAPVGRRVDPYGPRPPSDPHGRYAENKHIPGMDMMGPRSSSPTNMDVSTQAVDPQIKAEAEAAASTESPEPGPGSFLASPIRDSPGPLVPGGPHDPLLPPGPHGRLPPPGPYRGPRPGPYHLPPGPHGPLPPNVPPHLHGPPLPANGHPGIPMGGEYGPRPANGHAFPPRPGPGHMMDPRGPLPPHFRPLPPHHYGPMPPGVRGPMGPRPPFPPDMRYPGPRDHPGPPMNLPPGPPHPAHGDAYGPPHPDALHNSHSGPRQAAPQDSRPPTVKP